MEIYSRAKHILEKGELDSALKLFTDFINLQLPSNHPECLAELTDAYNSRGHIRYLWVEFDDAIEDYTQAIKLDPNFAVSYYNRGQIHYRLARFKVAEEDLKKCLELDSSFKDAQLNLEQVKKELERDLMA